jgi:tetratricopeptide (TPR) repeat protein
MWSRWTASRAAAILARRDRVPGWAVFCQARLILTANDGVRLPNFSLAQGYYGLALSYSGRWEEADAAARRALRLSPRDPFSAVYYGIAAYAQFSGRNYDEAIRLSREGIRQRSDFVGAHRVLTAAAGMTGQTDIASVALRELRRAQPNISLAWIEGQMPIKLDAEREHYLEGFRRAGLE